MDITKEALEEFTKSISHGSLNIPVVKSTCEVHGTEEIQDLVAHGPGITVFEYSCGCTSRHEAGKPDKWIDKDGNIYQYE